MLKLRLIAILGVVLILIAVPTHVFNGGTSTSCAAFYSAKVYWIDCNDKANDLHVEFRGKAKVHLQKMVSSSVIFKKFLCSK